mmetsp:Transcript_33633/g.76049  ORF Transcript_33633/g.76049 Transcript_33633/m.76049 type:complete len:462 (-) Transcript_33633:948-2333(-)
MAEVERPDLKHGPQLAGVGRVRAHEALKGLERRLVQLGALGHHALEPLVKSERGDGRPALALEGPVEGRLEGERGHADSVGSHHVHERALAGAQEDERATRIPTAGRPAYAVHVVRDLGGGVVLQDPVHTREVQPAGRHVRADQKPRGQGTKRVVCRQALLLRDVSMKPVERPSVEQRRGMPGGGTIVGARIIAFAPPRGLGPVGPRAATEERLEEVHARGGADEEHHLGPGAGAVAQGGDQRGEPQLVGDRHGVLRQLLGNLVRRPAGLRGAPPRPVVQRAIAWAPRRCLVGVHDEMVPDVLRQDGLHRVGDGGRCQNDLHGAPPQGLAQARVHDQHVQDLPNLVRKPHVEEAVHLVHHQVPDRPPERVGGLEVIEQTPRRCHQDRDALAQPRLLALPALAPGDTAGHEPNEGLGQSGENLVDLGAQLSRRGEDQGKGPVAPTRRRRHLLQFVDDRQKVG